MSMMTCYGSRTFASQSTFGFSSGWVSRGGFEIYLLELRNLLDIWTLAFGIYLMAT